MPAWLATPFLWLVLLYRRVRYGYTFRRIALTQGKYAIVDVKDYEPLVRYKWHAKKTPHTMYAVRSEWTGTKKVDICMHRQIMQVNGRIFVDHVNHNGLDNRRANLRPATVTHSARNRRKLQRGCFSSNYKGVFRPVGRKHWRASITVSDRRIFLGTFSDEKEAAKAYDAAARKYHGEFACVNFPERSRP